MNHMDPEINLTRKSIRKKKRKVIRTIKKFLLLTLSLLIIGGVVYVGNIGWNFYKLMTNIGGDDGDSATIVDDVNTEPFAVLISGIGTNGVDNQDNLADSINVIAVNPKGSFAEIVSIPRDSYLQRGSTCEYARYYDKITHSGYSTSCMESTMEELFDIEINYYVNLNFNGFVEIVDALGGVEMNVPDLRDGFNDYPGAPYDDIPDPYYLQDGTQWCEHDRARNPFAICFNQFGLQQVNGEQSLALARSRHYDSDFARSLRQTELIKAILQKLNSSSTLFSIDRLLAAVTGNVETNVAPNQFMDFIELARKLFSSDNGFEIRTTQLDGESGTFDGEISGELSYNRVTIPSIEDIRQKLAFALQTDAPLLINTQAQYFTVDLNQYASVYRTQDYQTGFLYDYMDVRDRDTIASYWRRTE